MCFTFSICGRDICGLAGGIKSNTCENVLLTFPSCAGVKDYCRCSVSVSRGVGMNLRVGGYILTWPGATPETPHILRNLEMMIGK